MKDSNFLKMQTYGGPGEGAIVKTFPCAKSATCFIENNPIEKIEIQLQQGPIKDCEINGVQIDDMLVICKTILEKFNKALPSRETACAITKIDEAILWLYKRTLDREERGVEGTSQA